MTPLDLAAVFLVTWFVKTVFEDVTHAVKGTTNPRYELKRQKAAAAGKKYTQPTYGSRDYFRDLYSDYLVAQTNRRRQKEAEKETRKELEKKEKEANKPVDDMLDVVREDKPAAPNVVGSTINPVGACESCDRDMPKSMLVDTAYGRVCGQCAEEDALYDRGERKPHDTWETPDGLTCETCGEQLQVNAGGVVQHLHSPDDNHGAHGRFNGDYMRTVDCDRCQARVPEPLLVNVPDGSGRVCRECADQADTVDIYSTGNTNSNNVIPMFPTTKEITVNSEATGLAAAIAFADAAASAHQSFTGAGSEGYIGALGRAEVGEGCVGLAREAQEASQIAAEKWAAHADSLRGQTNVKEAYQGSPDAGNKNFLLNG